jgi:hypothetical protein
MSSRGAARFRVNGSELYLVNSTIIVWRNHLTVPQELNRENLGPTHVPISHRPCVLTFYLRLAVQRLITAERSSVVSARAGEVGR